MERNYKYMVATRCMTYNQSPYILEALNGFVIQETSFPVCFIIVDDSSTDGEQEVLKRWADENLVSDGKLPMWEKKDYGELLVLSLPSKPNIVFVIMLLNENYYQTGRHSIKMGYISEWFDNAKYNALCEGDDYWIDPKKLQMQVDFLERHPEYVLCHTDFDLTTGKVRNHCFLHQKDDNYFPSSIKQDLGIGTLTTLYRAESYARIPLLWKGKGWPMGDLPMWIELSKEGKFKFFPIVTAKYRILPSSFSHGSLEKEIRFITAIREVRVFYADYYGVDLENEGYSPAYYAAMIKIAFKHKNLEVAKKYKIEAINKKMTSRRLWFYYYATLIPPFGYALRKYLGR